MTTNTDDDITLDEKEMAALEQLFAAEVGSAVSGKPELVQLPKKIAQRLEERGMIEQAEAHIGAPPLSVRVKHHVLTQRGHLAYCVACGEDVTDED